MHVLLLSTSMNTFVQRGSLLDLGGRFLPMMSALTANEFRAGAPNKSAHQLSSQIEITPPSGSVLGHKIGRSASCRFCCFCCHFLSPQSHFKMPSVRSEPRIWPATTVAVAWNTQLSKIATE